MTTASSPASASATATVDYQPPSLPDAGPGSDRFRCGGRNDERLTTIEHYQGHDVEFRRADGYLNLTALCRTFGKRSNDFMRRPDTRELLVALAERHPTAESFVVKTEGRYGGTWIHPELAVEAACWVNVRCKLWCQEIIKKIASGEKILVDRIPAAPTHAVVPQLTRVQIAERLLDAERDLESANQVIVEMNAKALMLEDRAEEAEARIEPLYRCIEEPILLLGDHSLGAQLAPLAAYHLMAH